MPYEIGYTIDQLEVGMTRRFAKTITEADIVMFAGVSGDINSVHLNQKAAEKGIFGGRIAHGMLSAGLISACIANKLPGPGTVYLAQNLKFRAPVRPGDTVTATVTVRAIEHSKNRVSLETICDVDGKTVIEGDALVLAPKPMA